MGQAEWLLILTCAGYVAPYAWNRLRTELRHQPVTSVQIDTDRLRVWVAELEEQRAMVAHGPSRLRETIRVEKVVDEVSGAWCASSAVGYVLTSGHRSCSSCVNIRTMRDRSDRYECTGNCQVADTYQS